MMLHSSCYYKQQEDAMSNSTMRNYNTNAQKQISKAKHSQQMAANQLRVRSLP